MFASLKTVTNCWWTVLVACLKCKPGHDLFIRNIMTRYIYVLRRVGMGTIPELSLRKVGILTLPGEVRIPTWHGSIPELSLRKVGIGTK